MLPEEEKEAFTNEADEAMKKRAKDQEEWEKNYGQLVKDRAAEAATAKAAKTTAAAGESNAKSWKDADWVPVDGRTSFVRDSSDESTHTSMFHSGAAAQRFANILGDGGKNETVALKEFEAVEQKLKHERAAAKGVQSPTKTTESAKKSAKKAKKSAKKAKKKRNHEEVDQEDSHKKKKKKRSAD
eukprot:scaffold1148_cov209-Alexandrium_tamarense.AAC.15